mgnify:CR=1 FL=1
MTVQQFERSNLSQEHQVTRLRSEGKIPFANDGEFYSLNRYCDVFVICRIAFFIDSILKIGKYFGLDRSKSISK